MKKVIKKALAIRGSFYNTFCPLYFIFYKTTRKNAINTTFLRYIFIAFFDYFSILGVFWE